MRVNNSSDGFLEKEPSEQQPQNVVDEDVAQAHIDTHRRGHKFTPPSATDFRSPCPALNALANHHYLPHNGRSISPTRLCSALQEGYGLSWPLAAVLTYGGFYLIKQWSARTLKDFAKHDCIEHDASLIHYDTWKDKEFAPAQASTNLIENLTKTIQAHARIADPSIIDDNESPKKQILDNEFFLNADIIGYLRHKRERCSPHLDSVHAEIARGEMALVLLIFASHPRSPFERLWMIPAFLFALLLSMFGYNQLQLRMRENAARRVLLQGRTLPQWVGTQKNHWALGDDLCVELDPKILQQIRADLSSFPHAENRESYIPEVDSGTEGGSTSNDAGHHWSCKQRLVRIGKPSTDKRKYSRC